MGLQYNTIQYNTMVSANNSCILFKTNLTMLEQLFAETICRAIFGK